ncbi:MAG: type II toxin-antitoxin system VapC family toxin [Deltaproteobacteria bacterium]|nr:type II toxin-antitoxin system VapC family toxin [Deltaproteobacteria bacterium]
MNLLLDTHAFLWFMEGSDRLSQRARIEIESGSGRRILSVASAWEMAIKASLGKLVLSKPLGELLPVLLADSGIELLPIEVPDVARVAALPFHHRDPFDRLIAAQALERGLTVVSIDAAFDAYGVDRLW